MNTPAATPATDGSAKRRRRVSPAILPAEGYARLPQVLSVIPVSRSAWWEGCKTGRYPAPIKLSPRVTVWSVDAIRKLMQPAARTAPGAVPLGGGGE